MQFSSLTQQTSGLRKARLLGGCSGGNFSFAERRAAFSAEIFVQFSRRQNQQEPFANRLRDAAFRTVKFAGGK